MLHYLVVIILDGLCKGGSDLELNKNLTSESVEKFFTQTVELVFNQIPVPVCFVDSKCKIVTFNNAFTNYYGLELKNEKGKFAGDVDPNARFPVILKTNKPEIGVKHKFRGKEIIVHRIPLSLNKKLVGGISITIIDDLNYMYNLIIENNLIREFKSFESKNFSISNVYKSKYTWDDILCGSSTLKSCIEKAKLFAETDFPVLISGESGVGKELFAHAIHNHSTRRENPFVKINCAAIPENLIESELFGHEEGAFTGAAKNGRIGKFELANTGTIFLDEIGDLPFQMQVKLLRVLQEKEIERIGGNVIINLDLRIIAATNSNLKEKVIEGTFRSDLYYRLNVLAVEIPPLRERPLDIPVLVKNISEDFYKEYGILREFPRPFLEALSLYSWPGNVRELKNVLERVMVVSKEKVVSIKNIPKEIINKNSDKESCKPKKLKDSILETEKKLIIDILIQNNFNKSKTAEALGIPRMTLYRKLKQIGSFS